MDEVRRPGRPRDAARDDALLDAARQVLLRDGYAGLSMEKVATLAGVGKPTLYRRWPSRAALVADAVLHSFLASVPGSPAPGPHATGSQRLADWFRAYAASVPEQGVEGCLRIDPGAQHDGVDQEADQP
ncbi:helix-turn-helix domain-containing protein, partial [Streptomyces albidoflavus]|uniref:TetR/AcrR family transcriptional regulator n=1 Tax=Streptomyces albidoflavus TaxID=1886 RepID=UPI0033DDA33D